MIFDLWRRNKICWKIWYLKLEAASRHSSPCHPPGGASWDCSCWGWCYHTAAVPASLARLGVSSAGCCRLGLPSRNCQNRQALYRQASYFALDNRKKSETTRSNAFEPRTPPPCPPSCPPSWCPTCPPSSPVCWRSLHRAVPPPPLYWLGIPAAVEENFIQGSTVYM